MHIERLIFSRDNLEGNEMNLCTLTYISHLRSYRCKIITMRAMASQITRIMIVYWTVYSGADQRKHQSSTSLAFVRGLHRSPVNSPHKGPVTRKMFPFDDVMIHRPAVTRQYRQCYFSHRYDMRMFIQNRYKISDCELYQTWLISAILPIFETGAFFFGCWK